MQISVRLKGEESQLESLTPQNKILKALSDFGVVLGHLIKPQHQHLYSLDPPAEMLRDSRYSFVSKLANLLHFACHPSF